MAVRTSERSATWSICCMLASLQNFISYDKRLVSDTPRVQLCNSNTQPFPNSTHMLSLREICIILYKLYFLHFFTECVWLTHYCIWHSPARNINTSNDNNILSWNKASEQWRISKDQILTVSPEKNSCLMTPLRIQYTAYIHKRFQSMCWMCSLIYLYTCVCLANMMHFPFDIVSSLKMEPVFVNSTNTIMCPF